MTRRSTPIRIHVISTYTSQLFRMVEIAPNLESFAIRSLNILDIDPLAFPSSIRLRCPCLGGVSVSSHALLPLLKQSAETIRQLISGWLN